MPDDGVKQRGLAYAEYLSASRQRNGGKITSAAANRARKNTRRFTKNSGQDNVGSAVTR
jgi:hypothetical protein